MNAIVQRYDRDAADYERYWAPVLQSTARLLLDYVDDFVHFVERRDGRVRILEVGVGTGALLRSALERWPAAELIAADAAPAMAELARSRLADGGYEAAGRVRFLNAPAEALSLPDASVDLVISTFVLQLVPDRIVALREAHRVLAPSGMVAYLTWLDRDA
ncbi:MAG TPA: class I SAM-dependent methyltransferase, partial [Candidatus Limnocylindrales bacterium]